MNQFKEDYPERYHQCDQIHTSIIEHWQKTGSFQYVIKATGPIANADLKHLRSRSFMVGVGDELTKLVFHDMLVVFSMIEQRCELLFNKQNKTESPQF